MARKIVDIGVEGNDGTGDSIREGFRKVNDNFSEIYAVFGQEGTLSFLNLGDVEGGTLSSYTNYKDFLPIVSSAGGGIEFKKLQGENGLTISYPDSGVNAGKIVLTQQSATGQLGSADGPAATPGRFGSHVDGQGFILGNIADPTTDNVNKWNSKFGYITTGTAISADKFPVTLGYADNRYINRGTVAGEAADTMVGYLSVPPGGSGTQVVQAAETVLKAGGSMTGTLFLNDHPGDLAGAGTPLGVDDKQAATKYYVDTTAYSSKVNLYVSTSGDDTQRKTPIGKEGRAWAYAYQSIVAAALKAEQLIDESPWEPGPYRQLIAYGGGKYYSEIVPSGIAVGGGLNGTTRVVFTNDSGSSVDQGVQANRDIIPGKLVVGKDSGARGFIVKYGTVDTGDYVDLREVTGSFVDGENLYFDQAVKRLEISIFIESGNYLEDYPIRIPRNCSILGDEFRRTVVRPRDRVSQSPWAATWFYRDLEFDGLDIAETNWGYHYLTDATNKAATPKNNKDIDVFLCNDATIIRQISCQGHGGFMMVLDPNGQILTKSPYCQQSGSFSGSLNKQAFRGGQYVDGQASSMPVTLSSANGTGSVDSPITEITITDAFRVPQTPTAFFVEGLRYKVDTFTDNGQGNRGYSELLLLNKDFIVAETIAYINDVVTPAFSYDPVKCSRDIGYIISAVAYDIAFDSNIQTINTALEYFVRSDYILFPGQKGPTIDAINFVKTALVNLVKDAISSARVAAKMNIILQILSNGIGEDFDKVYISATSWSYVGNTITVTRAAHGLSAGWSVKIIDSLATTNPPNGTFTVSGVTSNTFTYTTVNIPTGAAGGTLRFSASPIPVRLIPEPPVNPRATTEYTAGINNSLAILLANRELLKAEYIAKINASAPEFSFGAVGQDGYKRDIDRIVNAIIYDSIYDGDSQTILVTKNYFDVDNVSTITSEINTILIGLAWVRDIAFQVTTNTQFSGVFLQSAETQVRSTAAATPEIAGVQSTIAIKVRTLFNLMMSGLTSVDNLPSAPSYPSIDFVDTTILAAYSTLLQNANSVRSSTIAYINSKYLYDQFAAERDIRFLIDDLAHDIVYTGNLKMVEHGLSYFVGDAKLVSISDLPRTTEIIAYVKKLALYIVDNKSVPSIQITKSGNLEVGIEYIINNPGTTDWNALSATKINNIHNTRFTAIATGLVNAGAFVVGKDYTIVTTGTTNFNNIGATDSVVGTSFTATDKGTGNGTASQGTGNAILASSDRFYKRQFNIDQKTQRITIGAGATELTPSLVWVSSNFTLAFDKLQDPEVKSTIENDLITWVDARILGAAPNTLWYGYEYDAAKFRTDIASIIDAIGYDMMFGSNFRSISAALAYYRGTTASKTSLDTYKEQVKRFLDQLKVIVSAAISSGDYPEANGRLEDNMDVIIAIIDSVKPDNSPSSWLPPTPAAILPEPTGYLAVFRGAKEYIKANRSFIISGITGWISAQIAASQSPFTSAFSITFATVSEAWSRDVGFIVDALVYDLTYGGNLETRVQANSYFDGVISRLGAVELDKVVASYVRLQTVVDEVARGVTLTPPYTGTPQITVIANVSLGNTASAQFAVDRVGDIVKTLRVTEKNSKPTLISLLNTTQTMVSNAKYDGWVSAKDLLVANRTFIKTEVVNYLDYRYTFTITQSDTNQFVTYNTANMRPGMPVRFSGTDAFSVDIVGATTPIEVNKQFIVTFTFVRQLTKPDATKEYEILNNANPLYNIIVPIAIVPEQASTNTDYTYVTVVYPSNPGVFDYANKSTIRVAGGTFGGVNRDLKYYVSSIVNSTRFTITETLGGDPIELDSDAGTMYCALAYNRSIFFRDAGFIVSNISTDILYDGQYNSIKAGLRYFTESAGSTADLSEQLTETLAGINYINTIAQQIITNTPSTINNVATTYQSLNQVNASDVVTQVIDATNLTGGVVAAAAVSALITLINNIVANGKLWASNNVPNAVTYPKYVLQLNEESPYDARPVIDGGSGTLPSEFVIQGAGNTSMLSNDWTQLNDLGYGLVATNNGLIETVSVFTYYCWTAYYARNGGQIRSVGGSNAHGEYGCVAEGSDPFEIPDFVNLSDDMVQIARIFKEGPFATDMGKDKTTIYIDAYDHVPYNAGEVEINHGYTVTDGVITDIGSTRYEVASTTDVSATYFTASVTVTTTLNPTLVNGKYRIVIPISKTYVPAVGKYYVIEKNSNSLYNNTFNGWLCVDSDLSYITLEMTGTNPGTWGTDATTTVRLKPASILRLNLNTAGSNSTSASGLQKALENNQLVTVRANQNFKFYNVDKINPTRPSTALTWRADPLDTISAPVARVIAFNTKDPLSNAMALTVNTLSSVSSVGNIFTLASTSLLRVSMNIAKSSGDGVLGANTVVTAITSDTTFTVSPTPDTDLENATIVATSPTRNEVILTFDSGYNYVGLVIDQEYNTLTELQAGIDGGSSTKTLGSQVGDNYLSIKKITSSNDLNRISTGQMIFGWNGRVHRVESYIAKTISSISGYGIIKLSEVRGTANNDIIGSYQDLSEYVNVSTGITAPTRPGEGYNVTSAKYNLATQRIEYTYSGDAAPVAPQFNGSITAATLTVNSVTAGTGSLKIGSTIQNISGSGIVVGTRVTGQLTSAVAGGTYSSAANITTSTISTSADGNLITLLTNAGMVIGTPIVFTGTNVSTIISGVVYYIKSIVTSTAVIANSYLFGTTLTIGSVSSGTVAVGMMITGTNVLAGTYIKSKISGSGAGSTWEVSQPHGATGNQTITGNLYQISISQTATGNTFTLASSVGTMAVVSGSVVGSPLLTLAPGSVVIANQLITGTGIPTNTYVKSVKAGSNTITLSNNLTASASGSYNVYTAGLTGTYSLSISQPAPITATAMGVSYTIYGNSNASYNLTGPVVASVAADRLISLSAPLATVVASVSSSGVMIVTYVSGNTIQLGQLITGAGIDAGTYVLAFGSGTGGAGSYQLSANPNTVTPVFTGSTSGSSTTLTVSAVASGTILVGATIQNTIGSGLTTGTTITGQLTSDITTLQGSTTVTGTISTNSITVTSATNIIIGQLVTGPVGIPANTYVGLVNLTVISLVDHEGTPVNLTANITGASGTYTFRTAGKTGTYSMSTSNTFASTTLSEVVTAIPGTFSTGATRAFPSTTLYNPELVQDNTITIRVGLSKGEPADIIINISTCRVTSHDFSEIGTGGYNQTNYPNKIYGVGKAKNQKKEVAERSTGRVFWVSTDQDGFFRVGRFFTVDQGTGTVTFAASLALSNLDGLGFKRGRAISEFSDDDSFQDLSDSKVPTEHAVDGYLNRRLGIDRNGVPISEGTLGPGFLDRGGILEMAASLKMNSNKIINLSDPTLEKDAVNKRYVDNQQLSDTFVDVEGQLNNELLIYSGQRASGDAWVNAKSSTDNSQIQVDLIAEKELNIYVKRETITNNQISKDAHITQDKVDINVSGEQRDAGTLIASVTKSVPLSVTGATITGKSPNVLVRVTVAEEVAKPTVGIYYTVTGNNNTNANGKFLCVSSSARVGGDAAYIELLYAETPGAYGATGTVTPWETTVTTQLAHGFAAGDSVTIAGSTVTVISPTINSGTQAGSFTITSANTPTGVAIGQLVTGAGVPAYTYVKSISVTTITLTNKLTAETNGTYEFSTSINGKWPIASVGSTTSFVIAVDTSAAGTYNVTAARASKLGLVTFNKNQFNNTNGFVELTASSTSTITANIAFNSTNVTNVSNMANVSVGSVIVIVTLVPDTYTVKMPRTVASVPAGTKNIVQDITVTVTAITSATSFTVSTAFGGGGSATGVTLNVITGTPLSSIQQIPTDNILGNLSGTRTSPAGVTTGEIVKAGDGIKNDTFNVTNRVGYSNANTLVLANTNADLIVEGVMTLKVKDSTDPWKNTYGIFQVTYQRAPNSIVRTNATGQLDSTAYLLDEKLALDSSGSNIDFYTPGGAKFFSGVGTASAAAQPIIDIGTYSTAVNTTATNNTGGVITVASTANMYIGQELVFTGIPGFGGIVAGRTYYIRSISGSTITLSLDDTLKLVPTSNIFTGANGSGAMTVTSGGVLGGQVYLPKVTAINTVTLNPVNANVSIEPRSTNNTDGKVTIYPAVNGTINNMTIGGTIESPGRFTTVEVTSEDNATSSTDAPLKIKGGLAVAKKLFVGSDLAVGGNLSLTGNLNVKGITTSINSNEINVADKNILLAKVGTSTPVTATISGNLATGVTQGGAVPTGLIPGMVVSYVSGTSTVTGVVTIQAVQTNATTGAYELVLSGTISNGTLTFTAAGGNVTTADGGGITLVASTDGTADKKITWLTLTNRWTFNVGIETPDITVTNGFGADTVTINTLTVNGNATLGSDGADTITVNSEFVTGTRLKTAKLDADTLSLSAYDVNGTAYVDLIKLTSANAPKLEITSIDVGTINNIDIGGSTRGVGKFTTLFANDTATFEAAVTMTAEDKNVTFSPTGTGTVTISPASTVTISPADSVTISPTGKVDITPFAEGKITNMSIGSLSPASAAFTTLAANDLVSLTNVNDATALTFAVDGTVNNWSTGTTATAAVKIWGGALIQKSLRVGGIVYAPTFTGALTGNADTASQVKTKNRADTAGAHYITFVADNNSKDDPAVAESVYTDGSLSFDPNTNTLTVTAITGTITKATNLVGGNTNTLLGSIPYQTGVDVTSLLSPNITNIRKFLTQLGDGTNGTAPAWKELETADINGFATAVGGADTTGNAGTATKLKTAQNFSISGVVTATAVLFDGSGGVTLNTSYSGTAPPAASVSTTELAATGVTPYYLPMTVTAPSSTAAQNIMRTSNDLYYKPGDTGGEPSAKGLYAARFHGDSLRALYADLAENYQADAAYQPGTVVVFGGDFEVTASTIFNDRKVAGVVSTDPAYLMNTALKGENVIEVALTGRVPCKVIGQVRKGDMLVSSGKKGFAIVNNDPRVGTVIGKALENKTTEGEGVVEVVVGKH